MVLVQCEWCNQQRKVTPARAKTFRFCSMACKGKNQSANLVREQSPNWQAGERTKVCEHCGEAFSISRGRAMSLFRKQRFCSHKCGVLGRNTDGDHNPNWKGGHSNRSAKQHKWATNVISRDKATCRHCGAAGVELHAHHIKSFKKHPELRWDVSNGLTLCHKCHWAVHSATQANAVNSGKPLTVRAEGNPEPSFDGNIVEGVTTRGRAYRRVEANCPTCGKFVSKRLSDAKGKAFIACSHKCAGIHIQLLLKRQRQ